MKSAARWMVAAALIAAGCSDDDARTAAPWSLSDPRAERDMAPAPDMSGEPDLVVGPDMSPPPDMPGELCERCLFEAPTTGRVPGRFFGQESGIGPMIAGDQIVWRAEVFGPNDTRIGDAIQAMTPGGQPRRLVFEADATISLLDADGANLLYWVGRGQQGRLIARFGTRDVVMFEGTQPSLLEPLSYDGSPANMISSQRAAVVVGGPGFGSPASLIFVTSDGQRGEHQLPQGTFTAPFVRGQDIVLGAAVEGNPQAQTILWVREPGQTPRKVGARPAASQSSPVIVGEDVLWLRDGAVVRGDLMATREEVILPGPCGPLDADAIHAVVACGDDLMSSSNGQPGGATKIYMIDVDRAPQQIYAHGRAHIVAPRVSADRVVWLEYPLAQTFCDTPNTSPGQVMALAWDVAANRFKVLPTALGPTVAAPCLCCGAYWPPFTVSFAGDLAAWRYDTEGGELGLGWAKLGAPVCSPAECEP